MISEDPAPAVRRLSGRIVAATHNAGKLREIKELLSPYGVDAIGAAALGLTEPEETGLTFRDNAVLKAQAATGASGEAALADNSGLCVAGLGGVPGNPLGTLGGRSQGLRQGHGADRKGIAVRGGAEAMAGVLHQRAGARLARRAGRGF